MRLACEMKHVLKFREIIVPNYLHETKKGIRNFCNVTLVVDINSDITAETFNANIHDYYISSTEIERLESEDK